MGWDVSKKPRAPRARAAKRPVPALGAGKEVFDLPDSMSWDDLDALLATLPDMKVPGVLPYFVTAFSQQYQRWKQSAEPCRSETRFELRMIAHLAWKAREYPEQVRQCRTQLADLFEGMNRETKRLLLEQCRRISGDLKRADYGFFYRSLIDFGLIEFAALAAEVRMPGKGDYANVALTKTITVMAFVFEVAAGRPPTYSRAAVGPNANGSHRMVGASTFARFMLSFFQIVDPDLSETQVSNAVERVLASNRAAERINPQYFEGLSKLL